MILATEDLTFTYRRKAAPVIEGLTTAFEPGAVTVVTGASGSGKSTLLYVLALMLRATAGQVVWDGRPAADLPDAQRAHIRAAMVGFIFQDAMLDPRRTVLGNVCEAALFNGMPRETAELRALDLLARFGIENRAMHRPGEVSGGQAQRVALCRALVTNPSVVFADEPTGNLDRVTARVVWDSLHDHARAGATVIVATHDETLAAEADVRLTL